MTQLMQFIIAPHCMYTLVIKAIRYIDIIGFPSLSFKLIYIYIYVYPYVYISAGYTFSNFTKRIYNANKN